MIVRAILRAPKERIVDSRSPAPNACAEKGAPDACAKIFPKPPGQVQCTARFTQDAFKPIADLRRHRWEKGSRAAAAASNSANAAPREHPPGRQG